MKSYAKIAIIRKFAKPKQLTNVVLTMIISLVAVLVISFLVWLWMHNTAGKCSCTNDGVSVSEFASIIEQPDVVLVDVRTEKEYEYGHIDGAVNINIYRTDFVEMVRKTVPDNSRVAIYCQHGRRGTRAKKLLQSRGFDVVNLRGGYMVWEKQ